MDQVFGVHLHAARTAVESRGGPGHPAVAVNLDVDLQRHLKHSIITANTNYSVTSHTFSISFNLFASNIKLKIFFEPLKIL